MTVVALAPKPNVGKVSQPSWLRLFYRRHSLAIKISALVALFLVVAGWQWVVVKVPAGFVGVKYYRFGNGTAVQEAYSEGSHLKWPWDQITMYEDRLQQGSRSFDVLTRDGLMVTVDIACRFRLNTNAVGWLHKFIGPDYVNRLIVPALGSDARLVLSRYSTDELYSQHRAEMQTEITRTLAANLRQAESEGGSETPAIILDEVLILGIKFPPAVQAAIDRKMEQYQLREEYSYRIQREELESRRKEIEARGIAQFQTIVGSGISDNYLRWKAIDATLALAQSTNSKIVVLGNSKENMPFFLNGEDVQTAGTPADAASAAHARAETPLSGLAPTPPAQEAATDAARRSWLDWLSSGVRALLAPPRPESSQSEAAPFLSGGREAKLAGPQ